MSCRTAINQVARDTHPSAGHNVHVLQERKPFEAIVGPDGQELGNFVELKFDDPPPKGGHHG